MHFIFRFIRLFQKQKESQKKEIEISDIQTDLNLFSANLQHNIRKLKTIFCDSTDFIVREFSFGQHNAVKAALFFVDGMVNQPMINDNVITPLMHDSRISHTKSLPSDFSIEEIRDHLLSVGEIKTIYTYDDAVQSCLSGNAVLLIDGTQKALDIGAKGFEKRSITEPSSESSLRGPREGFTENLRTNTAMIRRKIKDPNLKIKDTVVGKRTKTQVNIIYIDGLVDPQLVSEVEKRIQKIDIDSVLASSYLESYIEDSTLTIFPTIWFSEKPDAVAGKILEGRVAIAVDGAPFIMSVPMLFIENFQSAEDYIKRTPYAIAMRLLRLVAFLISLFTPALYVALSTYHQELIPTTLLFTMAASGEGVPFPVVIETALMMIIFEILQEAGIRMPRPVGQTISIVGALVMGEAAVRAGLVGAPVVIVIAFTAVSSFALPFSADAVSLLRWFLLFLSATMGIFGMTIGTFIILVHLVSLRSFGAFYLAPLAPFHKSGMKDTFIRAPLWAMHNRPVALNPQDVERRKRKPTLMTHRENKEDLP